MSVFYKAVLPSYMFTFFCMSYDLYLDDRPVHDEDTTGRPK